MKDIHFIYLHEADLEVGQENGIWLESNDAEDEDLIEALYELGYIEVEPMIWSKEKLNLTQLTTDMKRYGFNMIQFSPDEN